MSITIPHLCPACLRENPTMKHLHAHRKKGELVRLGGYVGKNYTLRWTKPKPADIPQQAKKDQVA